MGEIRLDYCCRLCLKEGFSLINIFSHRSAAGDPLFRILSFIYDIKIFENDGLPTQICSPCMWRMIEFDACKRNVRSAEAEIMRLLNQTRPHPDEVFNDGLVTKTEETELDGSSEVGLEHDARHSEVPIKEEIDLDEWEMPVETVMKVPEAVENYEEVNEDDYHELESHEVFKEPVEVPAEVFEEKCNQQVFCLPLRETKELSDVIAMQAGSSASIAGSELPGLRKCKMKTGLICDVCNKSFLDKAKLVRHVRVHYDARPFSCDICGQRFKNNDTRRGHQLRHLKGGKNNENSGQGSEKELFPCDICGKQYNSKYSLSVHYNRHSNKFSCGSCGKSFGSNGHLQDHLRIHTKEKPFKCEVCDKSFNRMTHLKGHMVTHSDERPFQCSVCDKKFKSKGVKDLHELIHLKKN